MVPGFSMRGIAKAGFSTMTDSMNSVRSTLKRNVRGFNAAASRMGMSRTQAAGYMAGGIAERGWSKAKGIGSTMKNDFGMAKRAYGAAMGSFAGGTGFGSSIKQFGSDVYKGMRHTYGQRGAAARLGAYGAGAGAMTAWGLS